MMGCEVVRLFATYVVIPFMPYGDMGKIALMMLICSLHLSCALFPPCCIISTHFSTVIFEHPIVLDIGIHVISEPEHFGSMGISMWLDIFGIGLHAATDVMWNTLPCVILCYHFPYVE